MTKKDFLLVLLFATYGFFVFSICLPIFDEWMLNKKYGLTRMQIKDLGLCLILSSLAIFVFFTGKWFNGKGGY